MAALLKLDGPKKIIELEETPNPERVEKDAVHLWKGKLWYLEKFGCVLCAGNEEGDGITFTETEDESKCHCSVHGELLEVPYIMVKNWTIQIGDVEKSGADRIEDSMLFPVSMSSEKRDELVTRYLKEAEEAMSRSVAMEDEDDEDDV